MKSDKFPGWDGIPLEVYFTFWDILGPPLLDMINTAIDKGAFQSKHQCCNNAAFSLLNGVVKLYAKCCPYDAKGICLV